jgi:GNAT superfamily N-acetyltransferase
MTPVVRPARVEEAEVIAGVHVRSWQAAYVGIVPQQILDRLSVERRASSWRATIEGAGEERVWVVEDDGGVRGFASIGPARDVDLPPGSGELYAIYLEPEAWSQGFGRALFQGAAEDLRARGFDPLVLWVLTDNVRGRRFYEAAGWRADETSRVLDFDGTPIEEVRYRPNGHRQAGG